MKTIYELIEDLRDYGSVRGNIGILARLDEIQLQAQKMENRLLECCNVNEDEGNEL